MSLAIFDTLLILHIAGLMLGSGGGLGSTLAMQQALILPAQEAAVIRRLGPALARMSSAGIILMWITGALLVLWKHDGNLGDMPVMFWAKMAAVASLTIAIALIEVTYQQMKKGNDAVAARLPRLGPLAGISSLLAVIFAVLTFH